jgi:hypothetical protein
MLLFIVDLRAENTRGIEKYFLPREISFFSMSDNTGVIDKQMGRKVDLSIMIATTLNRSDRND